MINWLTDFDAVGALTGLADGLDEAFESTGFKDMLAEAAHEVAAADFDMAAASAAHAGYLHHVYEFGTAGINTQGTTTKFADPTSPAARLWVHNLEGGGGNYDIDFTFRPALAANPRKTTRHTGVPSKFLSKISRRKYVFWNKAAVMESGMTVEVSPKKGRFLFIPAPEAERGFVLTEETIETVPGKNTAGTFTAFWEAWWNTEGTNIMDNHVDSVLNAATQRAYRGTTAKGGRPKPPGASTASMHATHEKVSKKTKQQVVSSASAWSQGRLF
jgi:hypothetical protein